MTPEQAAHDTASTVVAVPAGFVTDPATFARGAELGCEGMDFYVAGRGGALGDVDADVVAASMWFFAPDTIRVAWDRTSTSLPRREVAQQWLACGHRFAIAHFGEGPDYARVAALLGRVIDDAAVAGAPLFAALGSFSEPDDAKALVQHRLNAIRELRGARHGAATLTVGLTPHEAVIVRSPGLAGIFGWPEPHPEAAPLHDRWALAEARTDRMLGRHLAVLDAAELDELVAGLGDVRDSVG